MNQAPLWKRILWMVAIWVFSVAVLGLLTGIIRFWLS